MKRIGNIIIDLKNIDSISTNGSTVLILFKSKNSKSYNEYELGLSCNVFLDEVEKAAKDSLNIKDIMLCSLFNGSNNGKQ